MRKLFRGSTVLVAVAVLGVTAMVVSGATASVKQKKASVQVCVLLPDTKSSVRWVQFDAPDFAKALKAAGVTYSINNALNDPQKQKAQAQACLAAGAKVVVETALDNGSAASIEKLFTSAGGKAIDYDRQVTGGSASVYVTFDGKAVGAAQASGIIAAMKANGTYKPSSVVAELWGGPTDQNAFWFKSGNDAVLNPLFKSRQADEGPAAVRAGLARHERGADLLADAREDEQQHPGGHRGERQHRRRRDRAGEGQAPEADPAQRPGCDRAGCPEHPLRLPDRHGVQVRARRGERRSSSCGRAPQRQDAEVEHHQDERQQEASRPWRFRWSGSRRRTTRGSSRTSS